MIGNDIPQGCLSCERSDKRCPFMNRFSDADALFNLVRMVYDDVTEKAQHLVCKHWIKRQGGDPDDET